MEVDIRTLKKKEEIKENLGETRNVCVSRELSKMFEENFHGTLRECFTHFSAKTIKGEIVIVVAGSGSSKVEDEGE